MPRVKKVKRYDDGKVKSLYEKNRSISYEKKSDYRGVGPS